MPTREVTYRDEENGLDVRIVVRTATAMDGMVRALLQNRAEEYIQSLTTLDGVPRIEGADDEATDDAPAEVAPVSVRIVAARMMARFLYSDLLAVVVEAEGIDTEMDVETFMLLPEQLTDVWQNVVYELNPHWYPFVRPEEPKPEDDAKGKKADSDN